MHTIDPTMSFVQVVQYYKDYVQRTKRCGRRPVSFMRFVTGRYESRMTKAGSIEATERQPAFFLI